MNQKEWKVSPKFEGKFEWYNKVRKIRKSLQYNHDKNAVVIHHLRDTEEQRKYNDEHYEMWGFNLDGTFEYGKYVIFVTKEQHTEIHKQSEETRKKNSDGVKASITPERRQHMQEVQLGCKNSMFGKKGELAPCYGRTGDKHPMFGKRHCEEAKNKITESLQKIKSVYYSYKESGGCLKWCEFMKSLTEYKKLTHTTCRTVDYDSFLQTIL